MRLTAQEIASMLDVSAVQVGDGEKTIRSLVEVAREHRCHLVTSLPAQTKLLRDLLNDDPEIKLGGNVGFPSGGQTTLIKALEARELVDMGCDELDMVIHLAKLMDGKYTEVLEDIRAVITAAEGRLVKVILECHYLTNDQIQKGCDLCIEAKADFVKTGTGWAPSGATLQNIALIKAHVGDAISIKASGGIRELPTLLNMYQCGASRFGISLSAAKSILEQAGNYSSLGESDHTI
jgi:deoxyribose-phosphate aldolase